MAGLAVNIDHIATLRQARRATYPDPVAAALMAEMAGADGIVAPGGRMVIPVGGQFQNQYMVEVTKNQKGKISNKKHYPVRFVPMTGKKKQ